MQFSDIKEFTYIKNTVTVDGVSFEVPTPLDAEFDAVQYHRGRVVLEEPLMVEAAESKYQFALDAWVEAKRVSELPVSPLPITTVTMRQARLALLQSGLLATIETAITTGTDEAMKIEWEYATEVKRDWSSLVTLAETLGMTSQELDNLFQLASTL